MFGLMVPHGAVGGTSPLLISGTKPMEALLSPESLHSLVAHRPARAPQYAVLHPPAPAGVFVFDLSE